MTLRDASTDLQAALEAIKLDPFDMVEFDLPGGLTRLTNAGFASVTYNAMTFTQANFAIEGLSISNDGEASAAVAFQNVDKTYTALFRQAGVKGSTVKVWNSARQSAYGNANDALQQIQSRIDRVRVVDRKVTIVLQRRRLLLPIDDATPAFGFDDVSPAGHTNMPVGGTVSQGGV